VYEEWFVAHLFFLSLRCSLLLVPTCFTLAVRYWLPATVFIVIQDWPLQKRTFCSCVCVWKKLSPGRMAETPRAGTGDSTCRSWRYQCSTISTVQSLVRFRTFALNRLLGTPRPCPPLIDNCFYDLKQWILTLAWGLCCTNPCRFGFSVLWDFAWNEPTTSGLTVSRWPSELVLQQEWTNYVYTSVCAHPGMIVSQICTMMSRIPVECIEHGWSDSLNTRSQPPGQKPLVANGVSCWVRSKRKGRGSVSPAT